MVSEPDPGHVRYSMGLSVIVYADTRGKARSLGGVELGWDYPDALSLSVRRAKVLDHIGGAKVKTEESNLEALGMWAICSH